MQLSGAPAKIVEAFAINGDFRPIPVPSQTGITPGAASYNDGFPPLNATPVSSGGIPPSILDMNGILNEATALDNWYSAGASFQFDSVFAAAIGGYPKGARLLNAAGTGFWISILDNNSSNPDMGGGGWIPDRAISSVYASAQQTLNTGSNKVLWDTVEFDPFGLWNSGGQYFLALWAGKYRFTGAIYLPSPAGTSGQNLAALVYKTGTLAKQCAQFPADSDQSLSYPFDTIINCAVADTIDVRLNVPTSSVLCGQVGSNEAYVYGQLEFLGA